jgi:SpoVK/Ycf46/Vps4 family AAA+-type ATPase
MSFAERYTQAVRAHYQGDEVAFAEISRAIATGIPYQSIRKRLESMVDDGYPRRVRMLQEQKKALAGAQGRSPQPPSRVVGTMNVLPPAPPPKQSANDLLQELVPQSFEELMLPAELKSQFDEILRELEYRDELAEHGLRARDRILLHGKPGNGKTSSAASLAHALGIPAYGVNLANLQGSYLGETSKNLARLFESLEKDSLVVFDEIDSIGTSRTEDAESGGEKERNATVNTFLTLLDRGGTGIIVATTNMVNSIDAALRRRFEEVIEVPRPTTEQKNALMTRLCAKHQVPHIRVDDCENYDEVTKRCKREARRIVMQEILAKEAKADD